MKVLLFARARELAETGAIDIDLPANATAGELRRRLGERCPRLAGLLAHSALAVNDEFAEDQQVIPLGAEIALLPPVSGG